MKVVKCHADKQRIKLFLSILASVGQTHRSGLHLAVAKIS